MWNISDVTFPSQYVSKKSELESNKKYTILSIYIYLVTLFVICTFLENRLYWKILHLSCSLISHASHLYWNLWLGFIICCASQTTPVSADEFSLEINAYDKTKAKHSSVALLIPWTVGTVWIRINGENDISHSSQKKIKFVTSILPVTRRNKRSRKPSTVLVRSRPDSQTRRILVVLRDPD